MKALFDTNILIDYLRGFEPARAELARFPDLAISVITWMEVMAGTPAGTEAATRAFLSGFALVALDEAVAGRAVAICRTRKMKLPDAIVRASAEVHDRLLVTRDERAFAGDDPGVRVPYRP